MELRRAVVADAAAVMAIYNREVLESTVTFDLIPRTLQEQQEYITSRSGGLAMLVVETHDGSGSAIAGFASISFYRDRAGYRTSVEDSVYVHRDYHGRGIGDLLLGGLVDRARHNGFHAMFGRVIDSAEASIALHRKHGFELVGIEREVGRKFGKWRNVSVLQCLL